MMIKETPFPIRLKQLRIEQGLSQSELSNKSGVSRSSITKYERGSSAATVDVLIALAKCLHCSVDYLVGINESKGISPRMKESLHHIESLNDMEKEVFYGIIDGYYMYTFALRNTTITNMEYLKRIFVRSL